ncbi:hypothetical protein HF313_19475 [Massilia atriviolacea]|uniref:Uncharacterized protein n=1 Tax=Massilia atriviolacea TaxID=2495579 RepID=A0A430HSR8_9BURK|nr:hypothetical protein [Massilia atriviolacea]RSZ60514.1 hypothetical protein EJB06_05225 [Massilia atriviolacea]
MSVDQIRSALSAPPGVSVQTTRLADNLQSMNNAETMLSQTVATVRGAPGPVQQQLAPLLAQFVVPLLNMGQTAGQDLDLLAQRMSAFIAALNQTAAQAQGQSGQPLTLVLSGHFNMLEIAASAIQAAALNASQILSNFQSTANNASAALNTCKQQLEQQDACLAQKAQALKQQMHDMTSGNCCDQIGQAFQMAFGNLRQQLEQTSGQIQQAEYVLMLNNNAIDGLSQMVGRLGDIASVSTSLQVTWRSMADGIGALQQDLQAVLADTTPAEVQADLAYAISDWQAVAATLAKVL